MSEKNSVLWGRECMVMEGLKEKFLTQPRETAVLSE